jgi:hypothetical protein
VIGTSATRLAMLIRAIGRLDAPAVNRLVAGSNPARGATANQILSTIRILQFHPAWHAIGTQVELGPPRCMSTHGESNRISGSSPR